MYMKGKGAKPFLKSQPEENDLLDIKKLVILNKTVIALLMDKFSNEIKYRAWE